jgi:Spy/CpxP family protein refolding chaperone
MKKTKLIALAGLIAFLTAWNVTAHDLSGAKGSFGTKHLEMMQVVLDLTDEQSGAMQKIFASNMQNIQAIIKHHGLKRSDMRVMRTVTGKFRQDAQEQLKTVLTQSQILKLREELSQNGILGFILLSQEEKQTRLQNILGVDEENAGQIVAVLEQERAKHRKIMGNLGFDSEQMPTFQQSMLAQREEIKKELSEILNAEQLEQFEKLSHRMQQRRGDHFGPFATKGE